MRTLSQGLIVATLCVAAIGAAADDITAIPDAAAQENLRELQELLAKQKAQLESQEQRLTAQQQQVEDQRELLQRVQEQLDALTAGQSTDPGAKQIATLENVDDLDDQPAVDPLSPDTGEGQVAAGDQAGGANDSDAATDPESSDLGDDFKGSIRLKNSAAEIKIGGYVKMSLVDTLDPLNSTDRFVTALIPVEAQTTDNSGQFSVTARQSRLNVELREKTDFGTMRAFLEGDFAGAGDAYRLRHAFGQFRQYLAGKTWSTFVDSTAQPEEIDFEGINGRINVRQPLVRYFPKAGRDANFLISLEDPAPDVTDGIAVSKFPDAVLSWRRVLRDRWHIKTSVLLRQVEAAWAVDSTVKDTAFGWGVSASGRARMGRWDQRDQLMFQFNYGDGYGRYVNDLRTEGGQDGAFDPLTGDLKTIKVFAGYVAFQHWWNEKMRSTLNVSWVYVDNLNFQPGSAYDNTQRVALNLVWSPVPKVDIGAEILWGQRENKSGNSATARQIQLGIKYRF